MALNKHGVFSSEKVVCCVGSVEIKVENVKKVVVLSKYSLLFQLFYTQAYIIERDTCSYGTKTHPLQSCT